MILPEYDAILDGFKDVVGANGQFVTYVGVWLEHIVHVLGESFSFRIQNGVDNGLSWIHR